MNRLVIAGDTSELSRVREWLRWTLRSSSVVRITDEQIFQVQLVLQEALTNIISHGFHPGLSKDIDLEISCNEKALELELSYKGALFDEEAVPAPSFDGSREHGFGLFIMKSLMDEVEHGQRNDGRCFIRLQKRLEY